MRIEDYENWSKQALAALLVQAEGDITALQQEKKHLEEEAERYRREALESGMVVGGLLRVLRDNDLIRYDQGHFAVAREPKPAHGRDLVADGQSLYPTCVCGAQWLEWANRCVAQGPTVLANPIRATRGK